MIYTQVFPQNVLCLSYPLPGRWVSMTYVRMMVGEMEQVDTLLSPPELRGLLDLLTKTFQHDTAS